MEPKDQKNESAVQRGTLYLSGVDPERPLAPSFVLLLALLGLLWVGLGVFSDSPLSRYGHVGLGLVLLFTLGYLKWLYRPKYLRYDESGLNGFIDGKESILLNWEAIDALEFKNNSLTVSPESGVDITISLAQLPYAQHEDLLPQLRQLAERNGVSVT